MPDIHPFDEMLMTAHYAAAAAITDICARYSDDRGPCGYAWVTVRPATLPVIRHCRKRVKDGVAHAASLPVTSPLFQQLMAQELRNIYGDKHWQSGWEWWQPGRHNGQSVLIHEAGAKAFAQVLCDHGIEAYVGSRLD